MIRLGVVAAALAAVAGCISAPPDDFGTEVASGGEQGPANDSISPVNLSADPPQSPVPVSKDPAPTAENATANETQPTEGPAGSADREQKEAKGGKGGAGCEGGTNVNVAGSQCESGSDGDDGP